MMAPKGDRNRTIDEFNLEKKKNEKRKKKNIEHFLK